MASLSPSSGALIDTIATDFVVATIMANDFESFYGWTWSITPVGDATADVEPTNFLVSPDGRTLEVNYRDADGLFPLVSLSYADANRVVQTVAGFGELPPPQDSPEIVSMVAGNYGTFEWELSVTASGTELQDIEGTETEVDVTASGTYSLLVEVNYNTDRDLLLQAINERLSVSL